MITQITDHQAAALRRVRWQFRGKPNYESLVSCFTLPAQTFEDAAYQMLTERWVDTAEGTQLDMLGVIVGRARDGRTDDAYRPLLRAQIAVNNSDGTPEDVYLVARLAINDPDARLKIINYGVAGLVLEITAPELPDDEFTDTLLALLQDTVSGGVRILIEFGVSPREELFTFAKSTFLNGGVSGGATSITVVSTAGFPAAGTVDIDYTRSNAESKAYTGKTATTFFGMSALAGAHSDTAQVRLNRTSLGFDQGKFAVAKG